MNAWSFFLMKTIMDEDTKDKDTPLERYKTIQSLHFSTMSTQGPKYEYQEITTEELEDMNKDCAYDSALDIIERCERYADLLDSNTDYDFKAETNTFIKEIKEKIESFEQTAGYF